jgi:hypothetical protein
MESVIKKKPLQIYLEPRLRSAINQAAKSMGILSASAFARLAMVEKINREKEKRI